MRILSLSVALIVPFAARAEAPPREAVEFFEAKVRPVLVENCFGCHGPKKQFAGLRLDSRVAILKGGDNGPAAVPGDPDKSLLVKAVRHADGAEDAGEGQAARIPRSTPWPGG